LKCIEEIDMLDLWLRNLHENFAERFQVATTLPLEDYQKVGCSYFILNDSSADLIFG
jgi:hypothetical protein